MSKITQTPSAQSRADKMAYSSLVSQIKRYLPMKMWPFFRMVGILFLLSLQLVACSVLVPPPVGISATATTTASSTTPGATPGTTPGTTPGATPGTTPGATPGTTPGATPPVVATTIPGATPPVVATTIPGATPPVVPTANTTLAFAAGTGQTFDGTVVKSTPASSLMSMSILQTLLMSNGSIEVTTPNGSTLTMIVPSQTDLSDFDDKLPDVGTFVKVEAIANPDNSFTAAKLSKKSLTTASDEDKEAITYQAVTTRAVEADHVIHFQVGRKIYTFTIASSADLGDFHGNAQSIQAHQMVEVEVLFNKSHQGTVIKVGIASS